MTLMNGRGWGRANRIILLHLPIDFLQHNMKLHEKSLIVNQKEIKRVTTCRKQHGKKSHCLYDQEAKDCLKDHFSSPTGVALGEIFY